LIHKPKNFEISISFHFHGATCFEEIPSIREGKRKLRNYKKIALIIVTYRCNKIMKIIITKCISNNRIIVKNHVANCSIRIDKRNENRKRNSRAQK